MTSQQPPHAITTSTTCGQCGVEERKLLHNVRLRGNFRRLCTTCVLRLHTQSFCPSCLGVYDRSPPENAVVCYKCYSSSHPTCISLAAVQSTAARGPTPCAACLNPSLIVFDLNLNRDGEDDDKDRGRFIDMEAAKVLLCAGKIAANSMRKAEAAAGMEADRRAKEAAFTKKRAREALDHVVMLMALEKKRYGKKFIDASKGGSTKVMSGNSSVVVVKDKKVDEQSVVLGALSAVELKENGNGSVDGVNGMDSRLGLGSGSVVDAVVGENGGVKSDGLAKVVEVGKACNGEGPGVVENGVVKPKV